MIEVERVDYLEAAGLEVNELWDSGACRGAGVSDPAGDRAVLHRRYAPDPDGAVPWSG